MKDIDQIQSQLRAFAATNRSTGSSQPQSTQVLVEQGYLRRRLFGTFPTSTCVAGRSSPSWLDCDDLFERGYIALDEVGRIMASIPPELETEALRRAVAWVEGRTCPAFTAATQDYFAWHYGRTFRG